MDQYPQADTIQSLLTDVSPEVRRMFTLLCDEAGFLVESKVKPLPIWRPHTPIAAHHLLCLVSTRTGVLAMLSALLCVCGGVGKGAARG
eukprot:2025408-Rhodomonas_salina.3